MPAYLYIFGFESPRQLRSNAKFGWDDEDSRGLLIEAPDEAAALAWGREVSEQFIKRLFKDEDASWKEMGYAHWIEPDLTSYSAPQQVRAGSLPDFSSWLQPYEGKV